VTKIKTHLINEHGDIPARTVRIRHTRGSLTTPTYAVNAADIDKHVIRGKDLRGIAEVSISFRPEQLKSMNKDIGLQQQLEYRLNSYANRVPSNQLVIAVPILEGKQAYSLTREEALLYGTYIAELISHPRIDIVCTPILHRIAEKNTDVLVKAFLDTMAAYDPGVALSIPYVSRETRRKIIESYLGVLDSNNRALLNILCVDYNGSNPVSKHTTHNYVLRYVKNLQEEINEPVIVYGVNVKYSKVTRKYNKLPARDLAAYFAQLDVLGKNHKRRPLPREVAERLKTSQSIRRQKLLNRKEYIYISIDKATQEYQQLSKKIELIEKLVKEGHHNTYIENVIRRINIQEILAETDILKQLFSGQGCQHFIDPLEYLGSKEITRIDNTLLKRLKSFAKILRPRNKKIDEYLQK